MNAGGIILAGGKSSRFHGNKALAEIASQRLIDRIVSILGSILPGLILVTNSPSDYKGIKADIVTDIIPGKGPLSGIHAGLVFSPYELNFVTACDMPFINAVLVEYLVGRAGSVYDAVVPIVRGYTEPLAAVYRKSCIPFIEQMLLAGRCKVTCFYDRIRVDYVEEQELAPFIETKTFFNINTRDDLNRAFPEGGEEVGGELR